MNILSNYFIYYDFKKFILIMCLLLITFKIKFYKISIFIFVILLFLLFFFRVPEINMEKNDKFIYAPCYGKIKNIKKTDDFLQISTFISIFDPHIQYFPYNGYLKKIIYYPGEFNPAYMMKKGKYNEKMIYNISTNRGMIIVSQIAGVLARSIIPFIKEKTVISQHEEIGMIKFGSRCDIFIPLENKMKLLVKKGDKIKGTYTKLIEFSE
jgi:phosphatidylserine decarboxylase